MNRVLVLVFAAAVSAAGCTSTGGPYRSYGSTYPDSSVDREAAMGAGRTGYSRAQYGVVETIRELRRDERGNWLPGALIGGVVGGVLGNQIGGGRGNDVATVAGVVGGAVIGGQVASRASQSERTFEVSVRLDDGTRAVLQQADVSELQPNMRVVVDEGRVRRY